MKSTPFLAGVAAALLLSACDQPAPWARAAAAPQPSQAVRNERAQAVAWNEGAGRFELRGAPLRTGRLWTFDGATDGFVLAGGEVLPSTPAGLEVRNLGPDAALRSPKGLALDGGRYSLVLVRLTRTRAGAEWDGDLFYSTQAHGETGGFRAKPADGGDPAPGETVVLVYDMANLKAGGDDWIASLIDQIRLDTDDASGGAFVVHQVAVTENPGAAALAQSPLRTARIADR